MLHTTWMTVSDVVPCSVRLAAHSVLPMSVNVARGSAITRPEICVHAV